MKRLNASQVPLKGPYFFMASSPYALHVGVNLHLAPSSGEIKAW
jgi:hypothetical protein